MSHMEAMAPGYETDQFLHQSCGLDQMVDCDGERGLLELAPGSYGQAYVISYSLDSRKGTEMRLNSGIGACFSHLIMIAMAYDDSYS